HLTGHRILVHVALAVDTVDGQALVEIAAGVEEVAGADNQALVGTRQYIGRVFHLTREYDAAIGKEGVDGVQRNGGNRFRQRNHVHGRTELDGARLDLASEALTPTFYRQPRLAVQIDEADDVTGENQVGVVDLGIDVPELRPHPRFLEEFARNVPERVPLHHRVAFRVILPENGLSRLLAPGKSGDQGRSHEAEKDFFHTRGPVRIGLMPALTLY